MYCGTCLRCRYQKTFSEGLVSVVSFDYATREPSVELVEEGEVVEEWTCTSCGRPIHLKDMQNALDNKVEKWRNENPVCYRPETDSWTLLLHCL